LCGSRKYPYSLQGGLFEIPRRMRVSKTKGKHEPRLEFPDG